MKRFLIPILIALSTIATAKEFRVWGPIRVDSTAYITRFHTDSTQTLLWTYSWEDAGHVWHHDTLMEGTTSGLQSVFYMDSVLFALTADHADTADVLWDGTGYLDGSRFLRASGDTAEFITLNKRVTSGTSPIFQYANWFGATPSCVEWWSKIPLKLFPETSSVYLDRPYALVIRNNADTRNVLTVDSTSTSPLTLYDASGSPWYFGKNTITSWLRLDSLNGAIITVRNSGGQDSMLWTCTADSGKFSGNKPIILGRNALILKLDSTVYAKGIQARDSLFAKWVKADTFKGRNGQKLWDSTDGWRTTGRRFSFGDSTGMSPYSVHVGRAAGFDLGALAEHSNIFGHQAGLQATGANNVNFFGQRAGKNATNASNSNFLGFDAGNAATTAHASNFFGPDAGVGAKDAYYSNFIGSVCGNEADSAHESNFMGLSAGNIAKWADNSNFFGHIAGYTAVLACSSNFFGFQAGYMADSASNSNFLGTSAGDGAVRARYSNFFGTRAGQSADSSKHSNFLGHFAGNSAEGSYITAIGDSAGRREEHNHVYLFGRKTLATADSQAVFGGDLKYMELPVAGSALSLDKINITDASNVDTAAWWDDGDTTRFRSDNPIKIGDSSIIIHNSTVTVTGMLSLGGVNVEYVEDSLIFRINNGEALYIGDSAGLGVTGKYNTFIGHRAGCHADSAYNSIFFGPSAGFYAPEAAWTVAIGANSAYKADSADHSVMLGVGAGAYANKANYSAFLGYHAGYYDTTGSHAIAIGNRASEYAKNSEHSITIGDCAGRSSTGSGNLVIGDSAGVGEDNSNVILIGKHVSATADSQAVIGGNVNRLVLDQGSDTSFVSRDSARFSGLLAYKYVHGFAYFDSAATTVVIGAANTYYNISNIGKNLFTVGDTLGITMQGDSAIINVAGHYKIDYSFTISGTNAKQYNIRFVKNNTTGLPGRHGVTAPTSGAKMVVSGVTAASLVVGDVIKPQIKNETDDADVVVDVGTYFIDRIPNP